MLTVYSCLGDGGFESSVELLVSRVVVWSVQEVLGVLLGDFVAPDSSISFVAIILLCLNAPKVLWCIFDSTP